MGWVWAQLEPNLILLGGRKRDSLLTEERKQIGLSQLAMLADQFWLNKVKMVMKEMAVDLVGDHKISTNMGKVLGGDGFSWSDQVESDFGGGDPPTSGFEGGQPLSTSKVGQILG